MDNKIHRYVKNFELKVCAVDLLKMIINLLYIYVEDPPAKL